MTLQWNSITLLLNKKMAQLLLVNHHLEILYPTITISNQKQANTNPRPSIEIKNKII